jgi:hypothetical protein
LIPGERKRGILNSLRSGKRLEQKLRVNEKVELKDLTRDRLDRNQEKKSRCPRGGRIFVATKEDWRLTERRKWNSQTGWE